MTLSAGQNMNKNDTYPQDYLVFRLGNEEYGIDILKVQEIRNCERMTRIPSAPAFVTGVTNLRGVIVPIIDLRLRFKLSTVHEDIQPVVIVLNLDERVVGVVVDGVVDVITLNNEQIKPTPDMASVLSERYLAGLGVADGRMIILVDIEKLLSTDELELLHFQAEDQL